MDKIYAISYEKVCGYKPNRLVDAVNHNGEILCIRVFPEIDIFYSPIAKALFNKRSGYYWVESAELPQIDSEFERMKSVNPFWKMNICRIDAPVLVLTEEEFAAL